VSAISPRQRWSTIFIVDGRPSLETLDACVRGGKDAQMEPRRPPRRPGRPRMGDTALSRWLDTSGRDRDALANTLGISRSYLDRLCAGRARPSLALALRLDQATFGAVPATSWVAASSNSKK
jgi:plasmid maintenance system antidote protein VapI